MARTHGHGNPKWERDETILALDLYLECKGIIPSGSDPRVRNLSDLLRSMPHHSVAARKSSFRNPDGVAFKLQNLRQIATGKGLANVSATDRQVWATFGNHPTELKFLANSIRKGLKLSRTDEDPSSEDDDEFPEGALLTAVHKKRERNRKIRKRLLARRRKDGPLKCELCDSTATITDVFVEDAMFEAHHVVPISKSLERKTRLSEMALVCANCHRLLHRLIRTGGTWLDIAQGRKLLAKAW